MATRQKILTPAEQQEIRQLRQENQRIQARLNKLAGTTTKPRQQTRATATNPIQPTQPTQPKVPRVSIRPMIPEVELQSSNYLVEQYLRTHPQLTRSEALGDLCVQSFHMALPRVKRQEQARLAKQQQTQQRATATQQAV